MKRFYKEAAAVALDDGYEVRLDQRPVRTPDRNLLRMPTRALADASAAEWNGQGDKLDMAAMPMTALAYAAVDRVGANTAQFVKETARFAETDLLCYRAPTPAELRARQADAWDPLLAWSAERHGVSLTCADGVMPIEQPEPALAAVRAALATLDAFRLTAAHTAAQILGSAVLTLALIDGRLTAAETADAAHLDDLYQMEHWGEDEDARKLLTRRRVDLVEIGRFIELLE